MSLFVSLPPGQKNGPISGRETAATCFGQKNGPISGRGTATTRFGQKTHPFSGRECRHYAMEHPDTRYASPFSDIAVSDSLLLIKFVVSPSQRWRFGLIAKEVLLT